MSISGQSKLHEHNNCNYMRHFPVKLALRADYMFSGCVPGDVVGILNVLFFA